MEIDEATTLSKALLMSSASLAGLKVGRNSPDLIAEVVSAAFNRPAAHSARPHAVANLLRLIGATLEAAQEQNGVVNENAVKQAQERTCPVFPFD